MLFRSVSQNGNSKRKPRPKITLLQDSQSDSCGRVRFGKRTEPKLQQTKGAVGGDEAACATGALDLGDQGLQGRLYRVKPLGRHKTPKQRGASVPILNLPGYARKRRLQRDSRLFCGSSGEDHCHPPRS